MSTAPPSAEGPTNAKDASQSKSSKRRGLFTRKKTKPEDDSTASEQLELEEKPHSALKPVNVEEAKRVGVLDLFR
jgi:hypothetical protein